MHAGFCKAWYSLCAKMGKSLLKYFRQTEKTAGYPAVFCIGSIKGNPRLSRGKKAYSEVNCSSKSGQ